jgi:hypothetical protein
MNPRVRLNRFAFLTIKLNQIFAEDLARNWIAAKSGMP